MRLESLANETLLELFEFFPAVNLLLAFHGLNSRFNALLFVSFRQYHLDFRSVSKHDFDLVCREYLPSIVNQIISLRLSDDNDTPQQSDLFLSHGFTFSQFTHLQSLSLYHIHSDRILRLLMDERHLLDHLTHLNIIRCESKHDGVPVEYFIDEICNLPKLTHCYLNGPSGLDHISPLPTVISSTLECLSIDGVTLDIDQLASLFQHTPRLRRLHASFDELSYNRALQPTISSLTVLKALLKNSLQTLRTFLQTTPNLYHLTVETQTIHPDGHSWEQIITDYLPNLKVFRLKMDFDIPNGREEEVDQLLDSFRSCFWLNKRRWFVRCHWYPQNISTNMCLYTLPYAFREFVYGPGIISRSTCPSDSDHWSYDRVHTLHYGPSLSDDLVLSTFHFSNVRHLNIMLPFDEHFCSIVPSFDHLISLSISEKVCDNSGYQIQALLDYAPCLSTLICGSLPSLALAMSSLVDINETVRRLDLLGNDQWFDDQECAQISCSPLGIQCEVLRIMVDNRAMILDLVNTMTNLRALSVWCLDDDHLDNIYFPSDDDDQDGLSSSRQDELVDWLRDHLSAEYYITRNTHEPRDIRLWLR